MEAIAFTGIFRPGVAGFAMPNVGTRILEWQESDFRYFRFGTR